MKNIILIMLVAALVFTGCASKNSTDKSNPAAKEEAVADTAAQEMAAAEEAGNNSLGSPGTGGTSEAANETASLPDSARKLIKRIGLEMETKDFDNLLPSIEARTKTYGGYVEYSQTDGIGYYQKNSRYATLTLRIPDDQLNAFLNEVDTLGNILSKQISTEDITLQYADTQSHKKALTMERDRLFELLEKAKTMEELIALETRLTEVRYELESFESQLRLYDNLVDYSTVTINIHEVERMTPAADKSILSEIKTGLTNTFHNISDGLKSFFIWFAVNLPYLVICAVIVLILVMIRKIFLKKRNRIILTEQNNESPFDDETNK